MLATILESRAIVAPCEIAAEVICAHEPPGEVSIVNSSAASKSVDESAATIGTRTEIVGREAASAGTAPKPKSVTIAAMARLARARRTPTFSAADIAVSLD
jgi:hypothetical protein